MRLPHRWLRNYLPGMSNREVYWTVQFEYDRLSFEQSDDDKDEDEDGVFNLIYFDSMCHRLLSDLPLSKRLPDWLNLIREQKTDELTHKDTDEYINQGTFGWVYYKKILIDDHIFDLAIKVPKDATVNLEKEWCIRNEISGGVVEGLVTHVAYVSGFLVMRHYNCTLNDLKKLSNDIKTKLLPIIMRQFCWV